MKNLKTITVAELMDLLADQDPDARVVFSTNYGDYHRTSQALPLRGDVEEVQVKETGYSNSGFAVVEVEDDDYDEDGDRKAPEGETFLLLR